MSHKVETMAWANEVPWHGLGVNVKDNLTPAAMAKAAKIDWKVEKVPVFVKGKAGYDEVPNEFAIVRDTDKKVLSTCGSKYKPVQNSDVMDFFKKFTEAGHMKMETAGSLSGGQYIWGLARLGQDFSIGKEDEVRPYLLIMSPHVHGKALLMQYTAIRVVCWNTLSMAIGSSLKGDGTGFRMPHSQHFAVKAEEAEKVLKLSVAQTEEFKQASALLAKKKISEAKTEEYFWRVLGVDPRTKEFKDPKTTPRTPALMPKFKAALEKAPGAQMITAKGTVWGALNAVTYIIDHANGKERDTALKNAWLGNHANTKRDALALALEYAK